MHLKNFSLPEFAMLRSPFRITKSHPQRATSMIDCCQGEKQKKSRSLKRCLSQESTKWMGTKSLQFFPPEAGPGSPILASEAPQSGNSGKWWVWGLVSTEGKKRYGSTSQRCIAALASKAIRVPGWVSETLLMHFQTYLTALDKIDLRARLLPLPYPLFAQDDSLASTWCQ